MVRLRNIMLAICHSIKVSTVLLNIVVHMVEKSLSMIVNPSKNLEQSGLSSHKLVCSGTGQSYNQLFTILSDHSKFNMITQSTLNYLLQVIQIQ